MKHFKILIFLLFILPINVKAVGISVTPTELEIKSFLNEEIVKDLIVKNAGSDVGLFEVYLDDFESFIKARPSSFILESQEEKTIEIRIYPEEPGKYTTNISVISKPLNKKDFQIGSGVKIPLEIGIEGAKRVRLSDFILAKISFIDLPFSFIAIILILFVYIFYLRIKIKKLKKENN